MLLLDDRRFDLHAPPAYHPERVERLGAARRAVDALGAAGVPFRRIDAREATAEELGRVHEGAFVEALERLRGQQGFLDPDTYLAPDSVAAARLAAGGTVELVEALLAGGETRALALPRPPGHHARPDGAMGFCFLNNVAVAAAHARARGLERVAVVDWDVHHGNGTQDMFWRDPGVLFVSLHQFPFYPGTGAAHEVGEGDGKGFTTNIPLGAGGGDALYRGAFQRVVRPILEAYRPELVLVSAGFDAAARDPLAQMEVSDDGFAWMTRQLAEVADAHAKGRMLMLLEGGYDLVALEGGLRAAAGAMAGLPASTSSPADATPSHPDLQRAATHAAPFWRDVT